MALHEICQNMGFCQLAILSFRGKYELENRCSGLFYAVPFSPKVTLGIIHLGHYKIFRKTISYPLIRTCMFAFQGVRNVSLSEDFVNVINDPLI